MTKRIKVFGVDYGQTETTLDVEELKRYFDVIGQDEAGTVLIRPKPDTTGKAHRTANIGVAILAKLLGGW